MILLLYRTMIDQQYRTMIEKVVTIIATTTISKRQIPKQQKNTPHTKVKWHMLKEKVKKKKISVLVNIK